MKRQVGLAISIGLVAFSTFAQSPAYVPVSPESLGLTRIVPDTLVWFNLVTMSPQIGGFVPGTSQDAAVGGSVEATARLMGDSTFLLAASTKATNDSAAMARTLVLIPATGGTPKLSNQFFDDAGNIYLLGSNTARQDGNPGRVGGDMRYGAVNYMTTAEATLFNFLTYFGSDSRWSNNFYDAMIAGGGRDYQGQTFQMNPLTLAEAPTHKACSPMFWPTRTNDFPTVGQTGRTGSSPIGLANGNFVTVGEDRSGLNNSAGNAAIATIFKADGSIVKNAWMVNFDGIGSDMWDNVGAWRGGFFARPGGGITYFFDNDGNALGTVTNNIDTGLPWDGGRSDGTRMCSDIRSHYVFMAGPAGTNVWLSVWDANTRAFITSTIVSEGNADFTLLGGTRALDRSNVACDAYDRVTVVYRVQPDNGVFNATQVAARVFKFDGTNFIALTPSFFPFIQSDGRAVSDGTNVLSTAVGFQSKEPSVAMTPRQILFYAEGLWNGIPNTNTPPATMADSHCYTILSHPDPIPAPRPQMTFNPATSTISWQADAGLFVLEASTSLSPGSWAPVTPQPAITRSGYVDTNDKFMMTVSATTPQYYRLVRQW